MPDALLIDPLVETLGRVLLHFLWQGALVAGALALALRLMRRRPAVERYAAALAALMLMVALPPATWLALPSASMPEADTGEAAGAREANVRVFAAPAPPSGFARRLSRSVKKAPPVQPEQEEAETGWTEAAAMRARRWSVVAAAATAPWMALGWLLGVAVLTLRMAGGWLGARRLRRQATPVEDGRWTRRFASLARQMGLRRTPRLLCSERIDSPATVGWWRPVVLAPVGFLAGLPPAQVEAILRHELAHIRRYDYLAALAQAAVETLLFYHPAVWWVSGRVRTLREHCCDERAARRAASRLTYARALTEMEGRRSVGLALSAAEGDLFERVRRVVQEPPPADATRSGRLAPALAVLLLIATVAVAACAPRAVGAEDEPASSLATPSDTTAAATSETPIPPEAPAPPSAVPSPPPPPASPASPPPPPDTTAHIRIFSTDPDTTTGIRVAVVRGDTVDIDTLTAAVDIDALTAGVLSYDDSLGVAAVPDFDREKWEQWAEEWEDWGERFGKEWQQQWTADSSAWNDWAERMEVWGDSVEVAFSDDLPFADSLGVARQMKILNADSVLASTDSLQVKILDADSVAMRADSLLAYGGGSLHGRLRGRLDALPDTLPRVSSVSVVAPHADRRERQALRRTADRLDERAEALRGQGQEEAADALREEAERLREEAGDMRREQGRARRQARRRQREAKRRAREARRRAQEAKRRVREARRRAQEARRRVQRRNVERQVRKQRSQALRQQAEVLRAQAAGQEAQAEALRARVEKLREEEAPESRIEALQTQVHTLEKQALTLKKQSRALRRRADRRERQQKERAEPRDSTGEELQDI